MLGIVGKSIPVQPLWKRWNRWLQCFRGRDDVIGSPLPQASVKHRQQHTQQWRAQGFVLLLQKPKIVSCSSTTRSSEKWHMVIWDQPWILWIEKTNKVNVWWFINYFLLGKLTVMLNEKSKWPKCQWTLTSTTPSQPNQRIKYLLVSFVQAILLTTILHCLRAATIVNTPHSNGSSAFPLGSQFTAPHKAWH